MEVASGAGPGFGFGFDFDVESGAGFVAGAGVGHGLNFDCGPGPGGFVRFGFAGRPPRPRSPAFAARTDSIKGMAKDKTLSAVLQSNDLQANNAQSLQVAKGRVRGFLLVHGDPAGIHHRQILLGTLKGKGYRYQMMWSRRMYQESSCVRLCIQAKLSRSHV